MYFARLLFILAFSCLSVTGWGQTLGDRIDSAEKLWDTDPASALSLLKKIEKEIVSDPSNGELSFRVQYLLADLLLNEEEYEKALTYFKEAEKIASGLFGPASPQLGDVKNKLGILYSDWEKPEEAEQEYLAAYTIRLGLNNKEKLSNTSFNLGLLYRDLYKYSTSEKYFKESRALRKEVFGVDHPEYLDASEYLAKTYWYMDRYTEAAELMDSVLQTTFKVFGKVYPEYTNRLVDLAQVLADMDSVKRAERLYVEAQEIIKQVKGNASRQYGNHCNAMGIFYARYKQFDKAIAAFSDALLVRSANDTLNSDYASTCNSIGILYSDWSKFDSSETYFLRAYRIKEKIFGEEHNSTASTLYNLAIMYYRAEAFEKSMDAHVKALRIRKKILSETNPSYISSLKEISKTFSALGKYRQAAEYASIAIGLIKSSSQYSSAEKARSITTLAIGFFESGEYDSARHHYETAMELWKQAGLTGSLDYATTCENLGNVYEETGYPEKAEELYQVCLSIRERELGPDDADVGVSCYNIGILHLNMGLYASAEMYLIRSKKIYQKAYGNNSSQNASGSHMLGVLYSSMDSATLALKYFNEARNIRAVKPGKTHPLYGSTLNSLGILELEQGNYEAAERYLLESKQNREMNSGVSHPFYANTCHTLGRLYSETGKDSLAERYFLEALQQEKMLLAPNHPDYINTCERLAQHYWKTGNLRSADSLLRLSFTGKYKYLHSIFEFTSETEKENFIENIAGSNSLYYSFFKEYAPEFVLEISMATRSLLLSSSQDLKRRAADITDEETKQLYSKWLSAKEDLGRAYLEGEDGIATLEDSVTKLEKMISKKTRDLIKPATGGKDPVKELAKEEAILDFIRFSLYRDGIEVDSTLYMAVVIRHDQKPLTIELVDEETVTGLFRDRPTAESFYRSSRKGDKVANDSLAYQLIWKKLEKYLDGVTKIYYAPDGLLHNISFSALPMSTGRLLSDKYRLLRVTSPSSVGMQEQQLISGKQPIMLFGGIDYNQSEQSHRIANTSRRSVWNYLPGTLTEVKGIDSLAAYYKYSVSTVTGVNASEMAMKKTSDDTASPQVLHIATHGYFYSKTDTTADIHSGITRRMAFSTNPMIRSGLILAGGDLSWTGQKENSPEDGILTSFEVSNLYLPDTKLTVLSACETGLGDIKGSEGVYGLQRAFKIAGVEYVLMSLWKVPDLETSEFMKDFYKNLFAGLSIDEAFFKTQTAMKNKYRSEPSKWAAWVLVR